MTAPRSTAESVAQAMAGALAAASMPLRAPLQVGWQQPVEVCVSESQATT
jgi:hypothetical protein